MPGFVGMQELVILGVVLLLIFGPKRLPELGRSMGRGLREFKDSVSGASRDEEEYRGGAPATAFEGTKPQAAATPLETVAAIEPPSKNAAASNDARDRLAG